MFFKANPFLERVHTQSNWHLLSPHAALKASDNPRQYDRALSKLSDITYEFEGITYTAEDYYKKQNLVGLMVLHDNKVIVEKYDQGVNADTTYMIQSSAKSFTATMVGIALKDGKIESLDDRVDKYAPNLKGTAYGETLIRHALMMSSGMNFFHHKKRPNLASLVFDLYIRRMSYDDKVEKMERRVESGTEFNYINTDTYMLSRVVAGAYNQPYEQVVQEKLWMAGGFTSDAQWGLDVEGNVMPAMSLSITLQDFAHFGQLHLDNFVADGQTLVTSEWIDMVQTPQAPFLEPKLMEDGRWRDGYSFQWWIPYGHDHEIIARGAAQQYLYINKKDNYVVAHFAAEGNVSKKEEITFYRAVGKYLKDQRLNHLTDMQ